MRYYRNGMLALPTGVGRRTITPSAYGIPKFSADGYLNALVLKAEKAGTIPKGPLSEEDRKMIEEKLGQGSPEDRKKAIKAIFERRRLRFLEAAKNETAPAEGEEGQGGAGVPVDGMSSTSASTISVHGSLLDATESDSDSAGDDDIDDEEEWETEEAVEVEDGSLESASGDEDSDADSDDSDATLDLNEQRRDEGEVENESSRTSNADSEETVVIGVQEDRQVKIQVSPEVEVITIPDSDDEMVGTSSGGNPPAPVQRGGDNGNRGRRSCLRIYQSLAEGTFVDVELSESGKFCREEVLN